MSLIKLTKDQFFTENWNCNDFLKNWQLEGAKLADLKQELTQLHANLQNELIQLINKDYSEFVEIGNQIQGLDVPIIDVRESLMNIRVQVNHVYEDLSESLVEVRSQLAQKDDLKRKKNILQNYHIIIKLLKRLEESLYISIILNQESEVSVQQIRPSILERCSRDYIGLVVSLEDVSSNSKFYYLYTSRAEKVKTTLLEILDTVFLLTIKQQQDNIESINQSVLKNHPVVKILGHLIRSYFVLGEQHHLYSVYGLHIVVPFLSEVFTKSKIDGGTRNSCSGLSKCYDIAIEFMKSNCLPFLEICWHTNTLPYTTTTTTVERGRNPSKQFIDKRYYDMKLNMYIETLFKPVLDALKKFPVIFSPGIAKTFHSNFTASKRFLMQFHSMLPLSMGAAVVDDLSTTRSSRRYVTQFLYQWNLDVYFSIRHNEVIESMRGIHGSSNNNDINVNYNSSILPDIIKLDQLVQKNDKIHYYFIFPATKELWHILSLCWSNTYFIAEISEKFLGLSLELVQNYHKWLSNQIVILSSDSNSAYESHVLIGLFYDITEFSKSLCQYQMDCLRRSLETLSTEDAATKSSSISYEIEKIMTEVYQEAMREFKEIEQILWEIIIENLSQKCNRSLTYIRTISQMYHMTSKPLPTRCTPMSTSILESLHNAMNTCNRLLKPDTKLKLIEAVAKNVSLEFARKSEDLMKIIGDAEIKLAKARKLIRQHTSETTINDSHKMRSQLILDVKEFGKDLFNMGVDITSFESYTDLLRKATSSAITT